MNAFESLKRGDKKHFHIQLYEDELDVLDGMCARFGCSRAAAVGAMIKEFEKLDLAGLVPVADKPGARSRRR